MMDDRKQNNELRRRRIEGLEEKQRFEEERRRLVSESLKNAGRGKLPNKRIVFKNSDDESEDEQKNGKLTLFEDDQDPTLNEQNPEDLLKNRLVGAKSAKLTKLESRFGHDQRFRIDERFVESDDENGEVNGDSHEDSVIAEKKAAMSILSKVLGHKIKSTVIEKKSSKEKRIVRPFQRFDPDDPEHVAWMEANQPATAVKSKGMFSAEQFNNEIEKAGTIVKEGQFYEMDETFAKELQKPNGKRKKSAEPFSFLSSIGRSVEPTESTAIESCDVEDEVKPKKKAKKEKTETLKATESSEPERPYFFVDVKDPKFQDTLRSFTLHRDTMVIDRWFSKHRPLFVNMYNKLSKQALKQKKRELQPSKYKQTSRLMEQIDRVNKTLVKPIVYGNSAEALSRKTADNHTHRWRMFVRPFFDEDVTKYIRKVQFRLHESYKNPLRTVESLDEDGRGFSIEETGWGEFEAQIKLFFVDINEKPVTVPYYLRLFKPEFTKPDGRKYVLYEHYDELIFTDPTVHMFNALQEDVGKKEIKTVTDFNGIKTETMETLDRAVREVSNEITELREKLRQTATNYESAFKQMDSISRAASVEGSVDSSLLER
ncbi:hypothetical protein M3Y98_00859100 [Aphelenchoides besseyi]|nr:hypothetical protein M3Y98_00859100 [Aphelenchoides besseyi]KAI6211158.1 hypothetical protein M3Y96_00404300 [Aphelenchoides besseyi]